jgi:lipoprotein NlpI
LYLAEIEVSKPQADKTLAELLPKLDEKQWSRQIAAFYLGQISEQQLLAVASDNVTEPKQLAEQLCEVYFYLAKWHALQNNPTQAIEYYKKTLATNIYEFVEHRYARLEMAKIRQQVVAQDEHDHAH